MLRFAGVLAIACVPVLVYVLAADDWQGTLIVALLVLGAFVGWHVLRARQVGDGDVWNPASVRSIELPVPRESLADPIADVLAARRDAADVQRSGFTIKATVGTSRLPNVGGWLATIQIDEIGGGSRVTVDVEPAEGRAVLDFGRGHRLASSIVEEIGTVGAALASEAAQAVEDAARRQGPGATTRG